MKPEDVSLNTSYNEPDCSCIHVGHGIVSTSNVCPHHGRFVLKEHFTELARLVDRLTDTVDALQRQVRELAVKNDPKVERALAALSRRAER